MYIAVIIVELASSTNVNVFPRSRVYSIIFFYFGDIFQPLFGYITQTLASCMTHAESGDGKTKSDAGILSNYSLLVFSHKKGTLESVLFATQEKRQTNPWLCHKLS